MHTPVPNKSFRAWRSAASLFLACAALQAQAQAAPAAEAPARPKLVVVMVIDGLPAEQLQRYRDQFEQGKGGKGGGLGRLLTQGAWYSNAHQAHGITVTAIGHTAVLSGAYPYRHGIIGNNWLDAKGRLVYCTEDTRYRYIGAPTEPHDGTSPANLRVDTLGDQLRYATGNRARVVTVSGKDRGAILLAGKTGTAYMYMESTGDFASSTYYMQRHPDWVLRHNAARPQDRYYGQAWKPLLPEAAYADDAPYPEATEKSTNRFPLAWYSDSGAPAADYYARLKTGPAVDELTLDFAEAALDGERLGRNPTGATDLLGVSLSGHDYVNHAWGPESRMSHDHLQRIDRRIARFFDAIDRRVGMDNVLVVLTADHGFANSVGFAQEHGMDAHKVDGKALADGLNAALAARFGGARLLRAAELPELYLDQAEIDRHGLARADVENAAARWLITQPGIADVFTRTQMEAGIAPKSRLATLMQRAWHRELSGDLVLVPTAYSSYGSGLTGATHGTPYAYDTNVPLVLMGPRWIRAAALPQYAEVVDIAPTLAHILRLRPPAGSEGRVLAEALK